MTMRLSEEERRIASVFALLHGAWDDDKSQPLVLDLAKERTTLPAGWSPACPLGTC